MKSIIKLLMGYSLLAGAQSLYAEEINFVQYPAGSATIEPAPNVIISVDDSGSMGETGISALKTALKDTFSANNIADKRLRIAWQSMNGCNTIPASNCENGMKVLDSTHRTNFLNWVDTLTANGGTPSHKMIRNAGDYLSRSKSSFTNAADWPWAEKPGESLGRTLSCRKSFHIFMTDGSWNSSAATTDKHVDADRTQTSYASLSGNIDATDKTLPDGTIFSPSTNTNLNIYKDSWGGTYNKRSCNKGSCWNSTDTDSINTLSDLAFHYWSEDLQPDIPNNVGKITKITENEVIAKNGKSVTLTPYWNPKNNPATWQSLTTYTIGYGTATNWNKVKDGKDQLLTWSGDTYSGSYTDLALGDINWPSPLCRYKNNSTDVEPSVTGTIACDGATPYGTHNEIGNRRTELWHMAINSRGKFIPANSSDDLKNAFKDIVSNIVADTSKPITGFASASGSISTKGTTAYISSYDSQGWKGGIYSQKVAQGSAELTANTDWGTKANGDPSTTGDKLDALTNEAMASRLVLTSNLAGTGISFERDLLDTNQKNLLLQRRTATTTPNVTAADFLQKTIDFLRGDRSIDGTNVGNIPFRTRESRQGDIVNSTIWYAGPPNQGYALKGYGEFTKLHATRTPMLYVGGNDGMLHGFSALNGQEKIAYIPKGVIKNLPLLTNPSYEHRYFVDGSAFTGDVDIGNATTPSWRTNLVGTLGAGGKGYYVLDVTQPGATSTDGVATNFNKTNAASLVLLDTTDSNNPDIGHIFSEPVTYEFNNQISTQITRLNNGRWAVVMGNGYNSTNQRAVLLIQYLDGDKSLMKITASESTENSTSNGLSAPRLVDINNDGIPDVVYAGDLKGNLWKFNIASANPGNWNVAFDGSPLFTATYVDGDSTFAQPITTVPLIRANRSVGGLMVAFGTGRNLSEGDRTDVNVQTFYAVHDDTRYTLETKGADKGKVIVTTGTTPNPITTGREALIERTFNSTAINGESASSGQQFWNMGNQTTLTYGSDGSKGWYFDFPESGERVIRNPRFYVAGSNVIEILSDRPASGGSLEGESCEPASTPAKAWRTLLGIEFGSRPNQQLLDANGDGFYNSSDSNTNRVTSSPKELALGGKGEQIRIGSEGTTKNNELTRPVTTVNWRQMQ